MSIFNTPYQLLLVKKISLVVFVKILLLLPFSYGYSALSTTTMGSIKGTRPFIFAPSTPLSGSSFDLTVAAPAVAGQLTTGDIIRLTYNSQDSDGDIDDSLSSIKWFCDRSGAITYFSASNITNNPTLIPGGQAYSELTLPGFSIGCKIGVEVTELTIYGDPNQGNKIKVDDVGANTTGGTPTPPGPVNPGAGLLRGIYLSTDTGYANNYLNTPINLLVGDIYKFVVWDDIDGDGNFNPSTDKEVTSYLSSIDWLYAGTPLTGNPVPSPTIPTGTSGISFTVPVNNIAATNAGYTAATMPNGAQGYYLRVKYQ